jgi:hypothetical protein
LKCLFVNILGLEALECRHFNVQNMCVQLLLCLLILVALARQTDTNPVRDVTHSLGPNVLVELSVDTDIGSSHHLACELLDFANGTRCLLLEGAAKKSSVVSIQAVGISFVYLHAVKPLVKVDGVVTSDHVRGAGVLAFRLYLQQQIP